MQVKTNLNLVAYKTQKAILIKKKCVSCPAGGKNCGQSGGRKILFYFIYFFEGGGGGGEEGGKNFF